jgi:hypothetical protein
MSNKKVQAFEDLMGEFPDWEFISIPGNEIAHIKHIHNGFSTTVDLITNRVLILTPSKSIHTDLTLGENQDKFFERLEDILLNIEEVTVQNR